jgi:hypothetical protein
MAPIQAVAPPAAPLSLEARHRPAGGFVVSAPVFLRRCIGAFSCSIGKHWFLNYAADGHRFADCSVMATLVITGGG